MIRTGVQLESSDIHFYSNFLTSIFTHFLLYLMRKFERKNLPRFGRKSKTSSKSNFWSKPNFGRKK